MACDPNSAECIQHLSLSAQWIQLLSEFDVYATINEYL